MLRVLTVWRPVWHTSSMSYLDDPIADAIKAQISRLQEDLETHERLKQKYRPGKEADRESRVQKNTEKGRKNDPNYGALRKSVEMAVAGFEGQITIGEMLMALEHMKVPIENRQGSISGILKKLARPGGPLRIVRKGKGNKPTIYKKDN